jgi:peptide/nickel transport system ATP-binding protein
VFARPRHPYTAALIASIPDIDPDRPFRTLGASDNNNQTSKEIYA